MAISYRDAIVSDIATALRAIAVADGYNFDIGEVGESIVKTPGDVPPDKFPALYIVDTTEAISMADIDSVDKVLSVVIVGYVKSGENKLSDLRKLMADIEKAVLVDPRRAGYALITIPQRIVTDEGMLENFGEVDFTFTVRYMHKYGDSNAE